jgi:cbb3-type cytochrome oxidase subunit 3
MKVRLPVLEFVARNWLAVNFFAIVFVGIRWHFLRVLPRSARNRAEQAELMLGPQFG